MIYTVTFNPSLDYIISVDNFKPGFTNRTNYECICPGGKGINVSIVLMNLGFTSTALGFVAGFTGNEIIKRLDAMGINNQFINTGEGFSRINIKLKSADGTEINGQGPFISSKEVSLLLNRLNSLQAGDILFLSGSIPASVPSDIYRTIVAQLGQRGVQIIVDATKELLLNVLDYRPFLIKPNTHELEELFGVELTTREDVIPYAKELKKRGAVNVLVSMGRDGAVLLDENGKLHAAPAPEGTLINSVGAGDSMIAGFMAGWIAKHDYRYAFHMGIAAGSATAFSENLASKKQIEFIFHQLNNSSAEQCGTTT